MGLTDPLYLVTNPTKEAFGAFLKVMAMNHADELEIDEYVAGTLPSTRLDKYWDMYEQGNTKEIVDAEIIRNNIPDNVYIGIKFWPADPVIQVHTNEIALFEKQILLLQDELKKISGLIDQDMEIGIILFNITALYRNIKLANANIVEDKAKIKALEP